MLRKEVQGCNSILSVPYDWIALSIAVDSLVVSTVDTVTTTPGGIFIVPNIYAFITHLDIDFSFYCPARLSGLLGPSGVIPGVILALPMVRHH